MERFFDESDPFTEEASPPCPSTPCPYALQPTAAAQSTPTPFSLPQHPPPWFSESPSRTPLARIQLGGGSSSLQSLRPSGSLHPSKMQQESLPDRSSSPSKDTPTFSGQPDLLVATTKHSRPPLPPLYVFIRYLFLFTNNFSFWIERIYISTFKVFCSSYIYSYQNQIDLFSFLERKFNINRNTN